MTLQLWVRLRAKAERVCQSAWNGWQGMGERHGYGSDHARQMADKVRRTERVREYVSRRMLRAAGLAGVVPAGWASVGTDHD